jgi:predicted dehydrogenase
VGEKGTLRWDNSNGKLSVYRAEAEPAGWEDYLPPQGFERNDLFLAEMRHFLALIRDEEKSACDYEEGKCSLRWALAAHQSALEKRMVQL